MAEPNSVDGNCLVKSNKDKDEQDNKPTIVNNNNSDVLDKETTWTTVDRDALYYKMDHKRQGVAYIFNHQTFKDDKYKDLERHGTDVDEKRLQQCLRNLNFNVHSFKDLKKDEIRHHISIAARQNYSDCNCFFLAVLSHGDNDVLYAYDGTYDPNEMFWDRFTADKAPTLAGKPKLFLIQSCQGRETDPGLRLVHKACKTETDGYSQRPFQSYRIPIYSDFLIMYASTRGHYAFRNTTEGSFYIRVLCNELEKHAYRENLLTILTIVNQRVALEFTSNSRDPDYHDKKQIPYFKSSLIRLLQFVDIKKEAESGEWQSFSHFSLEENFNGR